jgi:hypothetical protein
MCLKGTHYFKNKLNSTKNVFKTPRHFLKSLTLIKKSLNFSENAFNKNLNLYKSLNFSENMFKILKNKKSLSFSKKKPSGNSKWPMGTANGQSGQYILNIFSIRILIHYFKKLLRISQNSPKYPQRVY